MQASFGERGLHADEEATVRRIVSGGVRTRGGCMKSDITYGEYSFYWEF